MNEYENAPPEVQAATDAMLAEIEQAALDVAKTVAMEVGLGLDETDLLHIGIGVQSGTAATINWLLQRDMLKDA